MNPYSQALNWIKKNSGTGSANGLAKLILSIYNPRIAYSFRECTQSFDGERLDWARQIIQHFLEHGEDLFLINAGQTVRELCRGIYDAGLDRFRDVK
jgi:hypothetical protein